MTKLLWGELDYESGVDRGVFYPLSGPGEVWNGLISITENPTDSSERIRYIDGVKTQIHRKTGEFAGTINSYSYPVSFVEGVLIKRRAQRFGLSYRVMSGDHYQIHLVYNLVVKPSHYIYQQLGAESYSWEFSTLPVSAPGVVKTAHLITETSIAYVSQVSKLEEILYGSDTADARLPLPLEIFNLFEGDSILMIMDNGDGTWTATGPDSIIQMLDSTTFQITWPSAVYLSSDTYKISSL